MDNKRIIIALVAGALLILSFTCPAFSQMNGQQGMGGGRGSGEQDMLLGELVDIGQNSVTVMTQTGENKKVTITSATSFVKQTAADKSALVIGGSVRVIGQPFGQNAVAPMMVIILSKMEDSPGARGQGGQKMQGQAAKQRMQGPVMGAITGTNPLTIQQASGETTVAQLTDTTLILKETPINAADIARGSRVRIMPSQKQGSGPQEARKVIVLP